MATEPLDPGLGFRLRPATRSDHAALCDICLQTGDSGADATGLDPDAGLLGLYYAVPYQILAPDHAFVLQDADGACGYVLGAPDTEAFDAAFTRDLLPGLRARTKDPGADPARWHGLDWLRHRIHHPAPMLHPGLAAWPAHGHIDLLPRAQGHGLGGHLMRHLMRGLAEAGAKGIHLGVSPRNPKALGFYAALGFSRIDDPSLPAHTVFLGRAL